MSYCFRWFNQWSICWLKITSQKKSNSALQRMEINTTTTVMTIGYTMLCNSAAAHATVGSGGGSRSNKEPSKPLFPYLTSRWARQCSAYAMLYLYTTSQTIAAPGNSTHQSTWIPIISLALTASRPFFLELYRWKFPSGPSLCSCSSYASCEKLDMQNSILRSLVVHYEHRNCFTIANKQTIGTEGEDIELTD